jgi:hypothetical protein
MMTTMVGRLSCGSYLDLALSFQTTKRIANPINKAIDVAKLDISGSQQSVK